MTGYRQQKPKNGLTKCPDLLFAVFNRHKAHVRAAHHLANSLCIGRIVLVGFDVKFYELGSNQFDGMSQPLQLISSEGRRGTGLHADQAVWKIGKKGG